MKTYKIVSLLSVAVLVLGLSACKKYGRDFADGYDKAGANGPSGSVDTNMKFVDRSAYAKARIFPGLVDIAEPRVTDESFTLDLNFSTQSTANLRINVAPQPQFSTGYYAAPGELVKILVPEGVHGLHMQIGGHTDNLSGKIPLLRDPMIVNKKALFPGVNYVRNLYGGTIYINAAFSIPQPVTFKISGAVHSPDFVLGVDDNEGWKAKVRASHVPWLELRSNRVIFLVPRDKVLAKINAGKFDDAVGLMTEWNAKFEYDFNGWMGLSDNAPDIRDRSPQGAWRAALDIQISAGYGHNGFPIMGVNDNEWFNGFTNLSQLRNSEGMWGTYHEFGHNCQQPSVWSWGTLGETTNNLFNVKCANRMGVTDFGILHGLDGHFIQSIAFASESKDGKNFDGSDPRIDDPFRRMTPFIQIFELYGYDYMTVLYTKARHAQRLSNNDIDKHDFVYEAWSEKLGKDLYPFFYFWGILVSEQSHNKIAAKYPEITKAIWTYNPHTRTGGTASFTWPITITNGPNTNSQSDGPIQNAFDGNINTIWHSQWSPANGVFPYTFNIDYRTVKTYNSISFTQRQNNSNGYVKNVEVYSSSNGKDYTKITDLVLANNTSKQTFNFGSTVNTRYIRLVFLNNYYNNQNASMAEISLNP